MDTHSQLSHWATELPRRQHLKLLNHAIHICISKLAYYGILKCVCVILNACVNFCVRVSCVYVNNESLPMHHGFIVIYILSVKCVFGRKLETHVGKKISYNNH